MTQRFMKRLLLLPVAAVLLLAGCKKNNDVVVAQTDHDQLGIKSWIKRQGDGKPDAIKAQLAQLTESLQLDKLQADSMNDDENIVAIPLRPGFVPPNAGQAGARTWLVALTNRANGIKFGLLVQFHNEGPVGLDVLKNLLYQNPRSTYNGKLTLLDLRGKYLAGQTYENNRRVNTSIMKGREQSGARTSGCSEWYLIIHWEGPNGETWDTEVFLGITCSGGGAIGCVPTAINVETTPCDYNGGVGGYSPEDDGVEAVKSMEWHAFYGNVHGTWATIWATNRLKGKKRASEPQGGHFTGISLLGLVCNTPGILWDYTYHHAEYAAQTASSRIKCHATRGTEALIYSDRTRAYTFSEVFD